MELFSKILKNINCVNVHNIDSNLELYNFINAVEQFVFYVITLKNSFFSKIITFNFISTFPYFT